MTERFFQILMEHIKAQEPDLNTGETILEFLYECYSEYNNLDDAKIKTDFDSLYEAMNGMALKEMDKVIYPVCRLCRDHERSGFINGIMIGIRLRQELERVYIQENQ